MQNWLLSPLMLWARALSRMSTRNTLNGKNSEVTADTHARGMQSRYSIDMHLHGALVNVFTFNPQA